MKKEEILKEIQLWKSIEKKMKEQLKDCKKDCEYLESIKGTEEEDDDFKATWDSVQERYEEITMTIKMARESVVELETELKKTRS